MKRQISRVRFLCRTMAAGVVVISLPRSLVWAARTRRRYISIQMQGASMLPTLHNGERLKVDVSAYAHTRPHRNDIVILPPPTPVRHVPYLVKRVVGLPGDVVRIQPGAVFINERRLAEPYVHTRAVYAYGPHRVPSDTYFVLGDNRNNSIDSHLFGPLPLHRIVGKVVRT